MALALTQLFRPQFCQPIPLDDHLRFLSGSGEDVLVDLGEFCVDVLLGLLVVALGGMQ